MGADQTKVPNQKIKI